MKLFALFCLLVASASAFVAPASLKSQSALRSTDVSMGPKKKEEAKKGFFLADFLMSGRDGKLELLNGAGRKEDVAKRFDITYDSRPRKATKSTGNAKSGTINPKDASTW